MSLEQFANHTTTVSQEEQVNHREAAAWSSSLSCCMNSHLSGMATPVGPTPLEAEPRPARLSSPRVLPPLPAEPPLGLSIGGLRIRRGWCDLHWSWKLCRRLRPHVVHGRILQEDLRQHRATEGRPRLLSVVATDGRSLRDIVKEGAADVHGASRLLRMLKTRTQEPIDFHAGHPAPIWSRHMCSICAEEHGVAMRGTVILR